MRRSGARGKISNGRNDPSEVAPKYLIADGTLQPGHPDPCAHAFPKLLRLAIPRVRSVCERTQRSRVRRRRRRDLDARRQRALSVTTSLIMIGIDLGGPGLPDP
jgi:hypothetical protein